MRIRSSLLVAGLLASTLLAAAPSNALDAPVRLDSYQVLPRVSSFTRSGGFAGVNQRFRLEGDYDFATTLDYDFEPPEISIRQVAWFPEADLRAPLGDFPAFLDVDETLNLTGLRGELVPQPLAFTPFQVYRFEGIINDGEPTSPLESSTIELFAVTHGPWMYLRGETMQRPWMADYFEYELRALALRGGRADWNDDGIIDAADYTVLRDLEASHSSLDFQSAYGDLRANYGLQAPSLDRFEAAIASALDQQSALTAIPEPTTGLLVAWASITTLGLRSRRFGYRL